MTNTAETAVHLRTTGQRGKPGELHQSIVAKIIREREGSAATGFHAAHDALCDELGIDRYPASMIPDAYRFNRATCEIEIYEVEIRSPLSGPKAQTLGSLWEFWDCEISDWEPVLFVADRYGNVSRMDLSHIFYRTEWAERFGALFSRGAA